MKKGGELLVHYGNAYTRVGYSVANNKYVDAEYPAFTNIPPHHYPKNRKAILQMYDNVIISCGEERAIDLT